MPILAWELQGLLEPGPRKFLTFLGFRRMNHVRRVTGVTLAGWAESGPKTRQDS